MDVEITPDPSEEERQAILRALELERKEADEPAPWRRAGLEPAADQAVLATPRASRPVRSDERAGGARAS